MRGRIGFLGAVLLVSGSALAKGEDRDVPAFEEVQISSGIHAVIEIGPRRPLHLEGDEAQLADIEAVVEDGELRVGFKEGFLRLGRHWSNRRPVTVTIQTPSLRSVGASGGAEVRAALTRSDKSEINASGGSEVHVRGVDSARLKITGSGGSVLEIAGRADALSLRLSGGSHLTGKSLAVKDVDVEGSGGSEGELRADGNLRGGLSGGSQLHVHGRATGRVSKSGGSEVDFED